MIKYECVLFDLDGTLANTYEGIFNSYKYAAEQMDLPLPTEKLVNEAIGAKLTEVFRDKFDLDDIRVDEATAHYRKRYADHGIYEACSYPQMDQVLRHLKESGLRVGVATLKKEEFAKQMLEHLNLAQYFDVIVGMDTKDNLTKAGIIQKILSILGQEAVKTVLVGDSFYDALGAEEAGVDFIGVTYGFGFKKVKDVQKYKNIATVNMPIEICDII